MDKWLKIKKEYIRGGISYKKLAFKHKVNYETLKSRAQKENWGALRKETAKKTAEKISDVESDKNVSRATRLLDTSDKLLAKLNDVIDGTSKTQLKAKGYLKSLSSVLKDLNYIYGEKPDGDREKTQSGVLLMPDNNTTLVPPAEMTED